MDIKYAVESAHDENILQHVNWHRKKTSLSTMMSMLTLEPHAKEDSCNCDEETLRMRRQLRIFQADVEALDRNDKYFYQKQEQLIYKIFCEIRGLYKCDLQEYVEESEQDLQACIEENEQDLQECFEDNE